MRKLLIVGLLVLTALSVSFAQAADTDSVTSANSQIVEVRLSGFEDASYWKVSMPIDQGVISKMSKKGFPRDLSGDDSTLAKRDKKYDIPRTYAKEKVLGVKVEYITRGYNWFTIKPVKPIMVEGVCQSISVWVAGRNYRHWLRAVIQNFYGEDMLVYIDRLSFIGWKELVFSIPETVAQRDFHFVDKIGIKFNGFVVECDPMETYGIYYIYFDELRAMTDVFNEKTRDVDDMHDDW